jgi:hypothetical protein
MQYYIGTHEDVKPIALRSKFILLSALHPYRSDIFLNHAGIIAKFSNEILSLSRLLHARLMPSFLISLL